MRIRTLSILLLAILAVLVVVALGSVAQTPPPATGDWDIGDDTEYSNTSFDLPGGIIVRSYSSLTLTNVGLTMGGSGSSIFWVEPGGSLHWDGGYLTYSSTFPPRLNFASNCTVNGITFGPTYGLAVNGYGVSITNCTFSGDNSYGIGLSTMGGYPADGPIVIADNTFQDLSRNPIAGIVASTDDITVRLIIVGNRIDGVANSDAINLTVSSPSAHVVISGNEISNIGGGGISLNIPVNDLYLRMNANRVTNVGRDGVRVVVNANVLDFPAIVDLYVENAGNIGLSLAGASTPIDGLLLANHTNLDAGRAAISIVAAYNVTLDSSRIETPAMNFLVSYGSLDIHQSEFRRGSAQVVNPGSSVSSWRWLDMTCEWTGGIPLANQRVDVLGPVDVEMLSSYTDRNGYWGNSTYVDWRETEAGSDITYQLRPVLVHPRGDVEDGAFQADRDQQVTVTFDDPTPPAINVLSPEGDVVQNTTALTINGTCSDPYTGVALVQFSLDPNPDWGSKVWTDAVGTTSWHVDTLFLTEGVYTLYVRAYDRSGLITGNHSKVTAGRIVIDLTAPVITVTSPDTRRQPLVVNTTAVTIAGWVSEEVTSITVGRTMVPVAGTSFQLEAMVSEGLNDVVITATDLAGNSARYTLSVLRDTAPPVITLTAPAEGALLNVTSVLVAGLVDEGLPTDHVIVNGVAATLSGGAFQVLLKGLDEGPGALDVTAFDRAGNEASISVDVIIDSLPPALELVSPSDGTLTRLATVSLEGTSEAGAYITVQGSPVTLTGTTFTHVVDLVEGINLVRVVSRDDAGNENSTLVVVRRDSTPPQLVLYGLVNGTVESEGPSAYINGMTEAGATVWMSQGGSSVQVLTFPDGSFVQPLAVQELETLVTLRAEDAAGNTAFAQVTVLRGEVQEPRVTPRPEPVDPVVTATIVTTTTIILVGVAMTFEISKYALVLMVVPLYARIKKHEVLDNRTRLAIHGLVVENPGMHYNEIIREFDLTNGVAAYHLDVLEREGFIRSVRDGTLRRFYSSSTKVPGGHKATPDETREQILEMITANPGINQKSIVDELGIGRTLVGYHLKTLIDEGYIEAHKQGRFTVYSRTRKRWFRLN